MTLGEVCLLTDDVVRLRIFTKCFWADNGSEDTVHQTILSRETMLTVYNDGESRENGVQKMSLAFTSDDVDREYARLVKQGVRILEKPVTRPWGARNMSFYDPDGNMVYIRSLPPEATLCAEQAE